MVIQYRMEKSIRHSNKKPASFQTIIEKGDRLAIPVSIENESKIDPTDLDIPILYEDEHILIANKPANMATHPNEPGDRNTLLNGIVHYLIKKGEAPYIQHVHRLNKDTTGAILLAKRPFLAKSLFDRLLNERKVERYTPHQSPETSRRKPVRLMLKLAVTGITEREDGCQKNR